MNITRAISVRQPWASCIATNAGGAKRVENRGRSTSHRGPVAIHASLIPDVAATTDPRVAALLGADPWEWLPVGVIIAVADLVDCHQAAQPTERVDFDGDGDLVVEQPGTCCQPWGDRWYGDKPVWHLILDNVRILPVPVDARGQLSVPWALPDDVAAQVAAQLAGATA